MPVLFYHITQSAVEVTARSLLTRSLGAGWRVMLRGADPARLEKLDHWLWTDPSEGFLPHAMAGGPQDAEQPVLLGTGPIANGAKALMLVDGAVPLPGEAAALERVWVLFDGHDGAAVNAARGLWKAVVAENLPAEYWSEDSGRWVKKTASGG